MNIRAAPETNVLAQPVARAPRRYHCHVSFFDVWLSEDGADPGFVWDPAHGDRSGNCPKPQSPLFPWARTAVFWPLVRKIESGELSGRQCDWGCWVARVTKEQVSAFVGEVYADVVPDDAIRELRAHIDGLDPERTYLLVAAEG